MRNDFYNVCESRMTPRYREYVESRYWTFLQTIKENLPYFNAKVAEFGCGAANISRALHRIQIELGYVLIDADPRMLRLAQANMSEVTKCFELKEADITKPIYLPEVDLIHSHGVLEHFSDEQIRTIIRNQLALTPHLVHYVPGAKYEHPSFGDERLLTPEQWSKICKPDQIIEFNDGFDLILIWR